MVLNLKSKKGNRVRSLSENYTFLAPPNNRYSTFQPGGYYRMYHRVQAEKMKRSHYWLQLTYNAEKIFKNREFKEIQERLQPIKTNIKEGISKVEKKQFNKEPIEEISEIISIIEE
ncbi:MAG: hypothetical protein ACW98A_13555 [Candidatus Hodarchaeales archaeon]|jgi:hypothetical protein